MSTDPIQGRAQLRVPRIPRRWSVPEAALMLVVVMTCAVAVLGAVLGYSHLRAHAVDEQAQQLSERHGVTFEPLESVGRRTGLRAWSIAGVRHVCDMQSDALVCTDGSTFDR